MDSNYFDRDLSWLCFNKRVLEEAGCHTVPLMERFKFLSIFSSNLDEFFRVRYPAIVALSALKPKTRKKIVTVGNEDLVEMAQSEINLQLKDFGKILNEQLLPALAKENIVLYYEEPIKADHKAEVRTIFLSRILGFVQPVFLESNASISFIPENNQLYLINTLRRKGEEQIHHAVIKIPSDKQPRFFQLKPINEVEYIIFLDDIIRENVDYIFPGFEVTGTYSFKFNRDADLLLEDEYQGNLLMKIEKQLNKRDFGPPSRFLFEYSMPRNVQLFLASSFNISHDEMFAGRKYHNLRDLGDLPVENKHLFYKKYQPLSLANLYETSNIFKLIDERDVLLHFPYDSYNPILFFFNQAATDPLVEEIFITIYRVASDSLIMNALMSAVKNGKKVTVFIELKARFDEANNISWGKKLEEAGIKIIYSIPEIKVHSKIALVIKKENGVRSSYSILSTGNFNETTAKFYTDHTILTANKDINKELLGLFKFLQKRKKPDEKTFEIFHKLFVSQFNMIDGFENLINQEIKKAKKNKAASIKIKLNNLEEPYMISLLYKASQEGVKIQLLVRGICCLIPGVENLSKNIEVRRIVDRYLEHTRLFIFGEAEEQMILMGSSDWMTRNLRRRIEVCVTVEDDQCKEEMRKYFDIQWQDNDKAVKLLPDMTQEKVTTDKEIHNAQTEILTYLKQRT